MARVSRRPLRVFCLQQGAAREAAAEDRLLLCQLQEGSGDVWRRPQTGGEALSALRGFSAGLTPTRADVTGVLPTGPKEKNLALKDSFTLLLRRLHWKQLTWKQI